MNTQKYTTNIAITTIEKFYRVLQWCAHGISYFIFSLIFLLILFLISILNKELNCLVFTQSFIIIYYISISFIFIIARLVFYLFKRKHTYINLDRVTAENLKYKAFELFKLPFYSLIIFVILLFSYFIFANTSAEAIKDFYEKRLELTNFYSSQVEEFNREGVTVDYEHLSNDMIESLTDLTAEQRKKLAKMLETKKKIDDIDALTKNLETTLSNSMDNYALIEKQLEKIKQQIDDKDRKIADQNHTLDIKIRELEDIIKRLNENPDMLKKERDDLIKKREAIEKEIIRIKEHIENLEREKSSLEQDRSNLEITLQNNNNSTPVPYGQTPRITKTADITDTLLPSVTKGHVTTIPSPRVVGSGQFYEKSFIDKLFNIMILKIEMSSIKKVYIAEGSNTVVRNSITSVKDIHEIFIYGSTDIKLMDQLGVIEILDAKNRVIIRKTKRVTTDYNVTGSNFNFSFFLDITDEEQKKLDNYSSLIISIVNRNNEQFPLNMKSSKVSVQDGRIKLNIKNYLNL